MKMFMYIVIGALLGWFIVPLAIFLFWAAVVLFVLQFVVQVVCMLFVLFIASKENNNA
jgi:hypothetical protein